MKRGPMMFVAGIAGGLLAGTGVGAMSARSAAQAAVADSLAVVDSLALAEGGAPAVDSLKADAGPALHAALTEVAAADSTALDHDELAVEEPDDVTAEAEPVEEAPVAVAYADTPEGDAAPTDDPLVPGPTPEPTPESPLEASDASPQRLAHIFGAMKAKQAAAVLEELGDDDVRAILLEMSDRKAAAIVAALSPSRAASLSRSLLGSGPGVPAPGGER